jgi:putative heme-binding domain-containing protein
MIRLIGIASLLLIIPASLLAQSDLKDIPSPDPELERASFDVADGFEVNLFAADPLLAKPIQMNFDPAGRLWIASSELYPQIAPGQKANDKIIVLEDVDGDGRADKTSVFADGLLIPTGVEPGDGGAYVANSTELIHLRDTDGDGKADSRRVLLSGFGTEDTHHIIHTFRWGHDGNLYFNQSIYIHSHIETPYGVRRLGGGGIWQFRPESMRLEVFCRGFYNPWGHHFDRWGQSFATDGANGEGINYVFPGAMFPATPGARRILHGLNFGSPKDCGLEILSGRHLPDDWQGNMLTNDFRAHRVCRYVISEDQSGYTSREERELIRTTHAAFRPIDIKMGPDGAIYIADWYNPIIQHGEVDFRDPRRDHVHGRIWRLTAKGRPLVPRPKLVDAATSELLDHLKAPEQWTRHQARCVLKERGEESLAELDAWVEALPAADDAVRLEALWTYQTLNAVEPKLLMALLRSSDHHIRAAATRVLAAWQEQIPEAIDLLAVQVADDHLRVRLEAVGALAEVRSLQAAELALRAIDRPLDGNLDFAVWQAARDLSPIWLPEVQAERFDFSSHAAHLEFALRAVESPEIVRPMLKLLAAGKIPAEREESALELVATLGTPSDLALVFDRALDSRVSDERRAALLNALMTATRQRRAQPGGDLSQLAQLLGVEDEELKATAARAAGLWGVRPLLPMLTSLATRTENSATVRGAAIEGLVSLGPPEALATVKELAGSTQPAEIRALAITSLAARDLSSAATAAVSLLSHVDDEVDVASVVRAFVERKDGAAALVKALGDQKLPTDVAKLAARAAQATAQPDAALVEAFRKAGGLSGKPRSLSPDELQSLVREVREQGDPARGEAIFRRKDQQCLKCHAIGGAGGLVGPDLSSLGASSQVDYLVESILEPSKKIKENYHSVIVQTDDGRVTTGVKVRETDKELLLRNVEDQLVTIPLATIEQQSPGQSLMPVGLADGMTREELVHCVRFLSELGKVGGPYALGNARVVRRWQTLEPNANMFQRISRNDVSDAVRNAHLYSWTSAYSRVSGELPLEVLSPVFGPMAREKFGRKPIALVRCQLNVTTPGPIKLLINSTDGLSLWRDTMPIEVAKDLQLDVAQGTRTLTFAVDLSRRDVGLRCELVDVPGSPARVQIVAGK